MVRYLLPLILAILGLTGPFYYASWAADMGQPFISNLADAFLGGMGNTIPFLMAIVLSIFISLKIFALSSSKILNSKFLSFFAGKTLGIINFLLMLLVVFTNGVLVYMKFMKPEVYVLNIAITGPGYSELGIIIISLLAIILKKRPK